MATARFLRMEVSAARRYTCRRGRQKHGGAGIECMARRGGDESWRERFEELEDDDVRAREARMAGANSSGAPCCTNRGSR